MCFELALRSLASGLPFVAGSSVGSVTGIVFPGEKGPFTELLKAEQQGKTCKERTLNVYAVFSDALRRIGVSYSTHINSAHVQIATALFANSPFTEGKPNGYLSFRSQIWKDVDPHRTGMLPFVFDDDFG